MEQLTVGEFCAGYGGLGLAVESVFNARLAWYSEFEEAPSRIMKHHWPDAPNLGDMTKIDWATTQVVDILSGGTPCQDLSAAGRRRGMTEGTRSNLWVQMREAVAVIKPRYVVWENVRGAYSASASSDLEPCPGCVGDPIHSKSALRALGRVLGDLTDLGYDCQWRGLRASDVGAPHGRFRVFVLATYRGGVGSGRRLPDFGWEDPEVDGADHGVGGSAGRPGNPFVSNSDGERVGESVRAHGGGAQAVDGAGVPDQSDQLADGVGPVGEGVADAADGERDERGPAPVQHGPFPVGGRGGDEPAADPGRVSGVAGRVPAPGEEKGVRPHGEPAGRSGTQAAPDPESVGRGHGDTVNVGPASGEIHVPVHAGDVAAGPSGTPQGEETADGQGAKRGTPESGNLPPGEGETAELGERVAPLDWGEYTPAIRRWESTLGRRAPAPTQPTAKGKHRLNPRFTEWMMGVPDGWICDVPGVSRNDQLKAAGNGVVPQQATAALIDMLLTRLEETP